MALKFLSVRSVPSLFWSSTQTYTFKPKAVSLVFLLIGLFLFGLGEALLITAGLGVSPWTVFAQGITLQINWSIGFATLVISTLVLVLWVPLKQTPGIGTFANLLMIAAVLEFALPFLPRPQSLPGQIFTSVIAVCLTGVGGAIYLIANLGPGPRDGLMTGLQQATKLPIATIRSAIEITVVVLGWLLGGTVGLGTMLFAFGIGPSLATSMYLATALFPVHE